jgi:hypothetical protein
MRYISTNFKFIKKLSLVIVFVFSSICVFSQEIDLDRDQYKVSKDLENFIFYNSNKKIKINVKGKRIDSIFSNKKLDVLKYVPVFDEKNNFFVEQLGGVVFKNDTEISIELITHTLIKINYTLLYLFTTIHCLDLEVTVFLKQRIFLHTFQMRLMNGKR